MHYLYDPDLRGELPEEEARHALRVLRLGEGDEIRLVDGKGGLYEAEITEARGRRVSYKVLTEEHTEPLRQGRLHLAVAPTKNSERMEWLVEKATEIGFDELTFLLCRHSERRTLNMERLERIVVAAMKQSQKAWKPRLNPLMDFSEFLQGERVGGKYICHCHEGLSLKPHLLEVLRAGEDATVLVGPEGDFSLEEVQEAERRGYVGVSLGRSRLRTETAALAALLWMSCPYQPQDVALRVAKGSKREYNI
ncbi:MAG: 16S rRNA (uracil(1498)-N(3))-methyltransferase [Prevotellaceae bacterium]|nr:16S rRNA (uracil(1498)-N(3))-methyltransferase [Prevotellaceae bacterium]